LLKSFFTFHSSFKRTNERPAVYTTLLFDFCVVSLLQKQNFTIALVNAMKVFGGGER
jgi:hypothetical protein